MFFRLLFESFRRQRRRKLLAGVAILFGTTAVTAMLALATTIGDRIHRELAVYGANITVYPQAGLLDVKVGGVNLKPATGGAYLHESDLAKLRGIFWANNITGVSPELSITLHVRHSDPEQREGEESPYFARVTDHPQSAASIDVPAIGQWFNHRFATPGELAEDKGTSTGSPTLHPWWKLDGSWPRSGDQIVLGRALASKLGLRKGDSLSVEIPDSPQEAAANQAGMVSRHLLRQLTVSGLVSTGDATENSALLPLTTAQDFAGTPGAVSRVEVSARTKPEDAFARSDPDKLSPRQAGDMVLPAVRQLHRIPDTRSYSRLPCGTNPPRRAE